MLARLVNLALMFLIGLVFGMLGTIASQSIVELFGVRIPWGIAVSLLGVACLLIGLRLVSGGRGAALVAALGVVVAIALLSLKSFGGSVLIPAGTLGTIWTIAPVLIAAVVIGWPSVRHSRGESGGRPAGAAGVN